MPALFRRILIWASGGAVAGVSYAIATAPAVRTVIISLLIGSLTGAVAGVVASIRAARFVQAALTGAATGLSVGLLSFLLFEQQLGFVQHVAGEIIGCLAAMLIVRYLIDHLRGGSALSSQLWRQPE
jgi:hypothetical protein